MVLPTGAKKSEKDAKNLEIRLPQVCISEENAARENTTVKISRVPKFEPDDGKTDLLKQLEKRSEEMRFESRQKSQELEEKISNLRTELNRSCAFLQTTKKTLENVKLMYRNDMDRLGKTIDTAECLNQTDEELDEAYDLILEKVKNLKMRVQSINSGKTGTMEEVVGNVVTAFQQVGNGL